MLPTNNTKSVWLVSKPRKCAIDIENYAQAEDEARANRLGLWRDENPEHPWEFLHPNQATSDTALTNVR
jgi:endonuclease YncB( thermonuclease family)